MLIVSASSSKFSINNQVLLQVNKQFQNRNFTPDFLDLRDFINIPLFLDSSQPMPPEITKIHNHLQTHKYIVIFAPEHNGHVSAFFKNILDGISRINATFLEGKHIQIISVSKTERTQRIMSEGVKNTFYRLGAEECEFVNFNKYSDDSVSNERINELAQKIMGFSKD